MTRQPASDLRHNIWSLVFSRLGQSSPPFGAGGLFGAIVPAHPSRRTGCRGPPMNPRSTYCIRKLLANPLPPHRRGNPNGYRHFRFRRVRLGSDLLGHHRNGRAVGASTGVIALLIALMLGSSADHHDWEDRS